MAIRKKTLRKIRAINQHISKHHQLSKRSRKFIYDLKRRNPEAYLLIKKVVTKFPTIITYHVKGTYSAEKGHAPVDYEAYTYGVEGQIEKWGRVVDQFIEAAVKGGWPLDLAEEQEIGTQSGRHIPTVVFRGKPHRILTKILKDTLWRNEWEYGD